MAGIDYNRTFRVFVSSTFSDFVDERNALQEQTFPRVRTYCEKRGSTFQAIDLRWGVSEEAALEQQTMKICLQELMRCREVSPPPNFIMLVGNRYGWQPLPPVVDAEEFESLLSAHERDTLKSKYGRDDNSIPPVYLLLPRRGAYRDAEVWKAEEAVVLTFLRSAITRAGWSANDPRRNKYEESATHQEIREGALRLTDAAEHVFCYARLIDGLPNLGGRDFVDQRPDGTLDVEARSHMIELHKQLKRKLGDHYRCFTTRWTNQGPAPDHLDTLCGQVETDLIGLIETELNRQSSLTQHQREVGFHGDLARQQSHFFVGRRQSLARLRESLNKPGEAVIVHGRSGSGKTALLGHLSEQLRREQVGTIVSDWFLGKTPATSRLGTLLAELCLEFGPAAVTPEAERAEDRASLPLERHALVDEFHRRLAKAGSRRPVILVLDALDQLTDAEDVFSWLPAPLPPGVTIIASITGEDTPDLSRWPRTDIIRLEALERDEIVLVLDTWLRESLRTLQPNQWQRVLIACQNCPWPLYLRLVFEEARKLASFDELPQFGADIEAVVEQLFRRLAEPSQHGPQLVERSLGYLAATRHGLSEAELLDLLASDDEFFEDFLRHSRHTMPRGARRIPQIVWSRLAFDLQPYLSQRSSDGVVTLDYYHRQLALTARRFFLADEATTLARHQHLASLFMRAADPDGDRSWSGPASRAFRELAYHVACSAPRAAPAIAVYALAGDRRFRHAQFAALREMEPLLECIQFALGHAAGRRDGCQTVRFALERGYLLPLLARSFLGRLPKLARDAPDLARSVVGLLPASGSRLIALSLIAWHGMAHPPSRAAAVHWLDELAQSELSDVPVHAVPWLLEVVRDLHESGIDVRSLLRLIPDGPPRRIACDGWRQGSVSLRSLAAELSLAAPRTWTSQETARWQDLESFAWVRWIKGPASKDIPGFESEVINRLGLEGLEAVWTILAAQRLSHGARFEASVPLARALVIPALRRPDPVRAWYALAQRLHHAGETLLSLEYRDRLRVLMGGRSTSTADAATRHFLLQLAEEVPPIVGPMRAVPDDVISIVDQATEDVAGMARALRVGGRTSELFDFVAAASRRGIAFGVLDALLAEIVACDDFDADALRGISDALQRMDGQFPVHSGLGMYYFDFPWIYLCGAGLVLSLLAGPSLPLLVIPSAFVIGGLLDLLVWRRLGVFRRPERSRLPVAHVGSFISSIVGALCLPRPPGGMAPAASQFGFGVAAGLMVLGGLAAHFAGMMWTHFRPGQWAKIGLGVGVSSVLAVEAAPAIAALGAEPRAGVSMGAALALGMGLNLLVKWAFVRPSFGDSETKEEPLEPEEAMLHEVDALLEPWPDTKQAYRFADSAWHAGNWRDAVLAYDVVASSPGFGRLSPYYRSIVHLNRAMASKNLGEHGIAEQFAREAARINPDSGAASHTLALLLARDRGQFRPALLAVDEAIGRTPSDPELYSTRGLIRKHLGDMVGADADFRTALELWPEFLDGLTNYGILCEEQGRWTEAEELFRRAHEANPDDPEARFAYAASLHRRGLVHEAVRIMGDPRAGELWSRRRLE